MVTDVREQREKWTWEYIRNRRLDREAYLELYKKQLANAKALTPEELQNLQSYEDILPFDDIISYRQLARAAHKRDLAAAAEKKKKQEEEKKKQGWLSWGTSLVWGGGQQDDSQEVLTREEQVQAMKELYDAIGYDEDDEDKKEKRLATIPPQYVKAKLKFSLGQASISFRSSRPEDRSAPTILLAEMSGFSVEAKQRETWISASGGIKSVSITEYETLRAREQEVRMLSVVERAVSTDFFSFNFDLNPLDKGADLRAGCRDDRCVQRHRARDRDRAQHGHALGPVEEARADDLQRRRRRSLPRPLGDPAQAGFGRDRASHRRGSS